MFLRVRGFQDSAQPRLCWNKGFQITQLLGVSGVLSESQEEEEEEEKEEEEEEEKEEEGSKTVHLKDLRVTEQDKTGPRKTLSRGSRPFPAPAHTPSTEPASRSRLSRNKSCITSSAPWRSIIDEGARPGALGWACRGQGRPEDSREGENRTSRGPQVPTKSRAFED